MTRILRYLLGTLTCLTLAASAANASSMENATLNALAIYRTEGNFVFIRATGAINQPVSCSTNPDWQDTLSLAGQSGREIYAMLLAAKTAGHKVILSGTGLCSEHSTVESLNGMYVLE